MLKQSVSALLALAAACSLLAAAPAGAPASGPSNAFGPGVLPILRELAGEQTVEMPVLAFGGAKHRLLRHGFVTLTAKIKFTPTGGGARTRVKKLTLKAALGR